MDIRSFKRGEISLEQIRVLVLGAGYSGRMIARTLVGQGTDVVGTNRSEEKAALLMKHGIRPEVYAGDGFTPALRAILPEITHLILSIAPNDVGDPVLNDLRAAGLATLPMLKSIVYLSTVGVYGDHGGAWIDETTECRPTSRRSNLRLEAEKDWQRFADGAGVGLTILRLSGIYGPGRNAFANLRNGTAKRINKPGQVFNRIHVDDIAAATCHLLSSGQTGLFNVTDNEPAPPQDVVAFAASLMGVDTPPEIPFEQAQMTPMGRSFYEDCKRVSNRKLAESGYKLLYPSYREAMRAMWDRDCWQVLT